MKTKLQLLTLILALPLLSATAADVQLAWDANPATQNVTSYHVYERTPTGNVTVATSTSTNATITSVTQGVHTYVVTASNIWGESAPSNPVSTPGGPSAPVNVRVTIVITVP